MEAEKNELITRVGQGAPFGKVMRHYWKSVSSMEEFDPRLGERCDAKHPLQAQVHLMQH